MWDEGRDAKSVGVAATKYYKWAISNGSEGAESLYEVIDKYIIPKYGDRDTSELRFHDIEDLSNEIADPHDAKRATTVLLKIMEGGFMPYVGDEELRKSVEDDPESDFARRLKEHGQHILSGLSQ